MQPGVEGIDRDQNENQPRHRVENINNAHHQGIDSSASVASDETPGSSNEEAHECAAETDKEGYAPSGEDTVEDITAVEIRAEEVLPRRRRVLIRTGLTEGRG